MVNNCCACSFALANLGPNNTRSSISDSLAGFSSGVGAIGVMAVTHRYIHS